MICTNVVWSDLERFAIACTGRLAGSVPRAVASAPHHTAVCIWVFREKPLRTLRLCANSDRVGEFLAKAQRRKVRKEPCRESEPYWPRSIHLTIAALKLPDVCLWRRI